ncbi:MAG TPA: hypothetical protein VFH53_01700, partial [Phycisphaerae bacterium]|nr:hypothetical protein [Phycisphaerae bacterium]
GSGGASPAGWVTARANAYGSRPNKKGGITPEEQAQMAGWATAKEQNSRGPSPKQDSLFSIAEMFSLSDMTGWKLNPRMSAWLMGFPPAWTEAGVRSIGKRSLSRKAKQAE